jgi:perosamine synthetase
MMIDSYSLAVYQDAVRKNFSFLKATTTFIDALAKSIPLPEGQGYLMPVCELHTSDPSMLATFARWREENMFAYPTQFPVTLEGTTSWLRSRLLDVEDRMLFLVLDKHGHAVGHLGYASCLNDDAEMEIDNVVRGVKDAQPGIMSLAMQAILKWAEETIGPRTIFLRVFSDNDHAVEFYRRLGFIDGELQPLRRHENGNSISYQPVQDQAPADKYFLRMMYAPTPRTQFDAMILTAGPSISAREASYALDAAQNGWNSQWSKYIKKFEESFAAYVGTQYAVSTSSCTGALHLALLALGIGPGDEVIVPDITWVATANAVIYVGATPIFADIDPNSWCLDPVSFEEKITAHTRCVIPVHLYGHPAEMDKIVEIARRHNLYIIEDAAPAIGAEFKGQKTGTFGDFAAFSFQGAKLVVTGEGGMLVCNNEALFTQAMSLWDQGRDPNRTFWINQTGWKYKMSNIQAAIGLGQLERVPELIEAKRRIFSWYAEGLEGVQSVKLNYEQPGARSIYWMSSIYVNEDAGITRDDLRQVMKSHKIDTRPVFPAISQYPVWNVPQETQPVARRVGDQAINLPSGVCLKRDQVDYVCRVIRDAVRC